MSRLDSLLNPVLAILASNQDLEQGINQTDITAPEHGHHRCASEGKPEPDPVRPGESHQASKILHGWRTPGQVYPRPPCLPKTQPKPESQVRVEPLLSGARSGDNPSIWPEPAFPESDQTAATRLLRPIRPFHTIHRSAKFTENLCMKR